MASKIGIISNVLQESGNGTRHRRGTVESLVLWSCVLALSFFGLLYGAASEILPVEARQNVRICL